MTPMPSWHVNPFHNNLFILCLVLKDGSLDLQKQKANFLHSNTR